jgi:hypothetical protein
MAFQSSYLRKIPVFMLAAIFFLVIPAVHLAASDRPRVTSERLREGGFIDGTYPGNWKDTARRDQHFKHILGSAPAVSKSAARNIDQGSISIIQDDGTIVFSPNVFDLDNANLRFTPSGIGYNVSRVAKNFDLAAGAIVMNTLQDDDARQIPFSGGFKFTFYGQTYNNVWVNSDGDLTFGGGDPASDDRDVVRFESRAPRIGPLFVDLNPTCGTGSVATLQRSDRFIAIWNDVPNYYDESCTINNHNTFEVVLYQDGTIELSYNGIQSPQAVVGIAPGNDQGSTSPMVDFDTLSGPTFEQGAVFEYFTQTPTVSLTALARQFYQTHGDDYDFMTVMTNFYFDMGFAFAFEENIKNEITGLGLGFFDNTPLWGSQTGRLRSFLNLGPVFQYPSNPNAVFMGTNSSVSVIGQEFGHRWMAFADIPGGNCNDPSFSNTVLGRDCAHWSFFFNSHGSVMEGNDIVDNGDGTFTTTSNATTRYSDLDQYFMGLLDPSQVLPTFAVFNPVSSRANSSAPWPGVSFSGTRHPVTINDFITRNELRSPTVATSQKTFRQAWILLVPAGQTPSAADVNKVDTIRQAWQAFFSTATLSRGSLDTTLAAPAFMASIPGNIGSSRISSGQGPLSVSSGQISTTTVTQPVALAIFSLTQNNVLVTEAGVPAAVPSLSARVFVDYDTSTGRDSGVALVNPNNNAMTINVTMNNQGGLSASCPDILLPPMGHTAKYASEMGCTALSSPFLGTLTFTSAAPFAAVNLLQGKNAHDQTIFNALPVVDPTVVPTGSNLIFPQFVDGGGTPTQILLMNTSSSSVTGTINLYNDSGSQIALDFGSGLGSLSVLNYSIPANGMVKFSTTGLGVLKVGYAVVTPTTGQLPSGAVIFGGSSTTGGLASQAGVLNAVPTTQARLYIERAPAPPLNRNTGIALVNYNGPSTSANVTLSLTSLDGTFNQATTLTVPPNGHVAKFIDQLYDTGVVPGNFRGMLTLTSNAPIALITLRLTANQIGDNLYSTLPVANLNVPPVGNQYLVQIVNGGGYATQIILINTSGSDGSVRVSFMDDNGNVVAVPFPLM